MRTTGARFSAVAAAALTVCGVAMVAPGVADQAGAALPGHTIVYRDTGDDPPRVRMPDAKFAYWADVLHTSRALLRKNDGTRWVRVGVTSRRDFPIPKRVLPKPDPVTGPDGLQIVAKLDTKGGGMTDYTFEFNASRPFRFCFVYEQGEQVGRCSYWAAENGALKMSAPAGMLHVRKHIRWNVDTRLFIGHKYIKGFDVAPDVGRYPR